MSLKEAHANVAQTLSPPSSHGSGALCGREARVGRRRRESTCSLARRRQNGADGDVRNRGWRWYLGGVEERDAGV